MKARDNFILSLSILNGFQFENTGKEKYTRKDKDDKHINYTYVKKEDNQKPQKEVKK